MNLVKSQIHCSANTQLALLEVNSHLIQVILLNRAFHSLNILCSTKNVMGKK